MNDFDIYNIAMTISADWMLETWMELPFMRAFCKICGAKEGYCSVDRIEGVAAVVIAVVIGRELRISTLFVLFPIFFLFRSFLSILCSPSTSWLATSSRIFLSSDAGLTGEVGLAILWMISNALFVGLLFWFFDLFFLLLLILLILLSVSKLLFSEEERDDSLVAIVLSSSSSSSSSSDSNSSEYPSSSSSSSSSSSLSLSSLELARFWLENDIRWIEDLPLLDSSISSSRKI